MNINGNLRQAIANRIRDEIRRVRRHPMTAVLNDELVDDAPSPLEQAIGREGFEKYEAALVRLKASDREAIVARLELQQSYEEIAIALARPTANAARVAVMRASTNSFSLMNHTGSGKIFAVWAAVSRKFRWPR